MVVFLCFIFILFLIFFAWSLDFLLALACFFSVRRRSWEVGRFVKETRWVRKRVDMRVTTAGWFGLQTDDGIDGLDLVRLTGLVMKKRAVLHGRITMGLCSTPCG